MHNKDTILGPGCVEGTTKIDVTQGAPVDVATASFDPGYYLDATLKAGGVMRADLVQGFTVNAASTGEARK